MDRGAWWATVHRVSKSQTRLSDFTFTSTFHQRFLKYSNQAEKIFGKGIPWWQTVRIPCFHLHGPSSISCQGTVDPTGHSVWPKRRNKVWKNPQQTINSDHFSGVCLLKGVAGKLLLLYSVYFYPVYLFNSGHVLLSESYTHIKLLTRNPTSRNISLKKLLKDNLIALYLLKTLIQYLKTFQIRKHQAQMCSLVNSTKYSKKKLNSLQSLSEDRYRINIS